MIKPYHCCEIVPSIIGQAGSTEGAGTSKRNLGGFVQGNSSAIEISDHSDGVQASDTDPRLVQDEFHRIDEFMYKG